GPIAQSARLALTPSLSRHNIADRLVGRLPPSRSALAPERLGEANGPWGRVRAPLEGWLGEKVLFATDWPTISFRRAIDRWLELGLPRDVLKAILAGNAARILGLDDDLLGSGGSETTWEAA